MSENQKIRVLVVEDDPHIAKQIKTTLIQAGFDCHVALSAANFLSQLATLTPHLCMIDLGLPDFDGMDLVSEVKARSQAAVLILSGSAKISDKVGSLETGADDYMVKPFDQAELVARIRSILRRNIAQPKRSATKETACFRAWTFNLASNGLASKYGDKVSLTSAEAELLKVFVKNPRRVLPRERLVGQRDLSAFDRSVDIRISRLRKKLERPDDDQEIIKTVYGAGYIFVAEITWIEHDQS